MYLFFLFDLALEMSDYFKFFWGGHQPRTPLLPLSKRQKSHTNALLQSESAIVLCIPSWISHYGGPHRNSVGVGGEVASPTSIWLRPFSQAFNSLNSFPLLTAIPLAGHSMWPCSLPDLQSKAPSTHAGLVRTAWSCVLT